MISSDFSYRKELDQLSPYIPGTSIEAIQRQHDLSSVIKCASNENPLGCPISEEHLSAMLKHAHYYPDSAHHPLTQRLCEKHQCSENQLVLGNGSDDIFSLLAQAFLNSGDEVISSEHTFSVYKAVTLLMGGHYIETPMRHWHYNLEAITEAITPRTKLIFIANPNNPTGTLLSHHDLSEFLKAVPSNIIVVLDEAYREYVRNEDCDANEALLKKHPNLIITRTFSKCYGLAGFRLGYGLSSPDICSLLKSVKAPFNVNALALDAGLYVLDQGDDFVEKSRSMNSDALAFFTEKSKDWPVELIPTQANFICLMMERHLAKDAYDFCSKKGVIIRALQSFGYEKGIRITLCDKASNNIISTVLTEFFQQ